MAVFPDRFIRGKRFTTHFTLDDPSNQVVPKSGTDTKPGALALNLGTSAGDDTNATDALTAAGYTWREVAERDAYTTTYQDTY